MLSILFCMGTLNQDYINLKKLNLSYGLRFTMFNALLGLIDLDFK